MKTKNALLVSYVYPPVSSPGAVRTAKMKKFLVDYGIDPHVLTCKNAYSIRMNEESNLDTFHVHSVNEWFPLKSGATKLKSMSTGGKGTIFSLLKRITNIFIIPDRTISWYYPAIKLGYSIAKREKIDVVWSTSPNITNHLIASKIAKKYKIPHIIDFRDLWTLEPSYLAKTSTVRTIIDKKIEINLLRTASFITVVSPVMKDELLAHYPWLKDKIEIIYNGYDSDDYLIVDNFKVLFPNKYRLLYAGTFYGNERDPSTLFEAIHELSNEKLVTLSNFEFIIVGEENAFISELLKKYNIEGYVKFIGSKSFLESLAWIKTANRLLVITRKGKTCKSEMTSKIFDYMGADKPIVTITHEYYPIAQVTKDSGGVVIEFDDVDQMKQLLLTDLESGASKSTVKPYSFTRAIAAKQLSSIMLNNV